METRTERRLRESKAKQEYRDQKRAAQQVRLENERASRRAFLLQRVGR